uniref:Ig-like domain-containing protein n=1 Tax=Echeneis naucrates TaxID=173247 RepID=A0A665U7L2_ECHNA
KETFPHYGLFHNTSLFETQNKDVHVSKSNMFCLPGPEITVIEGHDVTLPCSISEDITAERFDWRADGQKEVYVYDAGLSSSKDLSGQHEQFKGRVSHFPGGLKDGNASIKISNTKVSDSGKYSCEFRRTNQKQLVKLLVGSPATLTSIYGPFIRTLGESQDGVQLQCEVLGASPKPEVQWKDREGNILPAEEPKISERGGSYDITLQIKVTKTGYYRCVSTQESIRHQTETETYVPVRGEFIVPVLTVFVSLKGRGPSCRLLFVLLVRLVGGVLKAAGGRRPGRRGLSRRHDLKDLSGQHEQFKGRVSHFPGGLKDGNASIKISNTKVSDSGKYSCEFRRTNQTQLVKLLVGEYQTSEYTSGGPRPHRPAATSGLIPSEGSDMLDI